MRINQDSDHLNHMNISSYQLYMIYIYIYIYIYTSFDCNPPCDARGIFLDISKAFDSVWHEGLIYEVKRIGVTGLPLEFIQSFLSHRFQRVLLNGQSSTWLPVTAGKP